MAIFENFTDSYFESKQLIAVVLHAHSGSIRFEITNVEYQNQAFTVSVNRNIPQLGTDDMRSWLALIELDAIYPANTGIVVNITDVNI